MVQGQSLSLVENGNFVQEILHQPKGAQPSADKAPQKTAKDKEKSQRGKGYLKSLPVQQRLERPYGTGGQRTGTGITVQPRNTGIFQVSPVNFSVQIAISVTVCKNCKNKLYRQSKSVHISVSPDPDTFHADHHRFSPYHGKLIQSAAYAQKQNSRKCSKEP